MQLVDLSEKVAVVTGGAGGIGREISGLFAQLGAKVVVADLVAEAADNLAAELSQSGASALGVELDVRNPQSAEAAAQAALDSYGRIDVLVNGAGWDRVGLFQNQDAELWTEIVAINYMGVLNVTKACIDPMMKQRAGSIVSIASDNGRVGGMGEAVYSGAKAAVIGFSKALAREVARRDVRVNCVSPALTETAFLEDMKKYGGRLGEMLVDGAIQAAPFKRPAKPLEIAQAVAFLASDAAGFVTGQVLSVNGGATMVD